MTLPKIGQMRQGRKKRSNIHSNVGVAWQGREKRPLYSSAAQHRSGEDVLRPDCDSENP